MSEEETLVRPFYLRLVNGSFLRETARARAALFVDLRAAAPSADSNALTRLFNSGGWREQLCAAWFVGLQKLEAHEPRVAELLLKSAASFAGQGYCFALARL